MLADEDKSGRFELLSRFSDTSLFLEEVQQAADENRNALGFLARSVFEEFARRDQLYVLIQRRSESPRLAGYLLFQRRFPRTQVVQVFVQENYRGYGLATRLVDQLKRSLTEDGFTSIYARVAEDLTANAFWDRQGFYVQRTERGGESRNRQILVRCHELDSPQLFPRSGISADNPLGLKVSVSEVVPTYLIDLNVLFDLAPRRLRQPEVISLFQAERMNFCRLAISDEIREELRRTAYEGKTDPMEGHLYILPVFPLLRGEEAKQLLQELASLIFDGDIAHLTQNDLSDLHHVATVIQHKLSGLITSDKRILAAAPKLASRYGAEVLSPSAFKLDGSRMPDTKAVETSENATLTLLEASNTDQSAIHGLLSRVGLSGSAIATAWLPTGLQAQIALRFVVWKGESALGFLAWAARPSSETVVARVAVDEDRPEALDAAHMLLIFLLERLAPEGPRQIQLELAPHQSLVRDVANALGFRGTPDQYCLGKLILGRALIGPTWRRYQEELSRKVGLKLPEAIPAFRRVEQQIQVLTPDGNRTHVALDLLESLLAPALLCLPGRPAVITPVRKSFSEPLFGHVRQRSLLPQRSVSLFHERHYISGASTLKHFRRGTLILFYESARQGGSGQIVAIARVREAYLKPVTAIRDADLERSVLTLASLDDIGKSDVKTVAAFDNIFPLHRPVPLASLQRIGCGRPNDLITTRPITDVQSQQILAEAFGYG